MFGQWYETDSDCCQHVRSDEDIFEMIQAVWLDITREDRARGLHEYCICRGEINLNDYSDEEIECYIGSYGYTLESLQEEYEDNMWDIVAECILEEVIICDSCVVADADSREEAKEIIKRLTTQN